MSYNLSLATANTFIIKIIAKTIGFYEYNLIALATL